MRLINDENDMQQVNRRLIPIGGLLMSLCVPIGATDDIHIDIPEGLIGCMDESESLQRLSCYDREMARLSSTTNKILSADTEDRTTADAGGITAGAPESRPVKSDDLVQQELQADGMPPQRANLTATIIKISKKRYGELIISLDNGQVWAEKIPSRSMRLNVGDIISIRQGRFGGYRLSGRGNRSTEVTRIQ